MPRYSDAVKTLVAEAANQSPEGMYAIATTMVNRSKQRKLTLDQVVNQRAQYTGRWRKDLDQFVAQQPPHVMQRAQAALDLARQQPMSDADHYLTVDLLNSGNAPSWTRTLTPVKQVGDHMFFSSTRKRR